MDGMPLLSGPSADFKMLKRELTLIDTLSIVVGIIVGSGIFTTPGVVLAQAGSLGEGLIVWLVAGGLTLCSTLLYAELGTSIPVSSGHTEFFRRALDIQLTFSLQRNEGWNNAECCSSIGRNRNDARCLTPSREPTFQNRHRLATSHTDLLLNTTNESLLVREDLPPNDTFSAGLECYWRVYSKGFTNAAFGPSWGFSFVWTSFWVLFPGSINIFATSLAQYFLAGITSADFSTQDVEGDPRVLYIAVTSVAGLTVYNFAGIRLGSFLQNAFSLCKSFLVLVILGMAAVFLTRDTSILQANITKPFVGSSFVGLGPSMVAALWAYDGLQNVVFLTEEMKNSSRDIPRAGFAGLFLVTSAYLAINLSYLSVLPSSDVKSSIIVAMDATKVVFGHHAGRFIAILVALSLLGSLNALLLCGGRYLFSAARDGHLIYENCLGKVNPRTGAPVGALFVQGMWSICILLLSPNIVKLLNYFSISSFLFTGLIAVAHWKLRHQYPELPRPFRVPLHPCLNVIVISTSTYMMVSTILADPLPTIGSLVFCFSSFPVYRIFIKYTPSTTVPNQETRELLS